MTLLDVAYCYEIELFFNSHNCDENHRRVSREKEYILTWLGKTEPTLCSFNFTGGSNAESHTAFKVCFESVELNLPSFDMYLIISDSSKTWEFDSSTRTIEQTCVDKAFNLMVRIVLTSYYKESSSYRLKLKIVAKELLENLEKDKDFLHYLEVIIENGAPVFLAAIILYCLLGNRNNRERLCAALTGLFNKIMGRTSTIQRPHHSDILDRRESVVMSRVDNEEHHTNEIQESLRLQEPLDTNSTDSNCTSDHAHSHDFPEPPPSYEDVVRESEQSLTMK